MAAAVSSVPGGIGAKHSANASPAQALFQRSLHNLNEILNTVRGHVTLLQNSISGDGITATSAQFSSIVAESRKLLANAAEAAQRAQFDAKGLETFSDTDKALFEVRQLDAERARLWDLVSECIVNRKLKIERQKVLDREALMSTRFDNTAEGRAEAANLRKRMAGQGIEVSKAKDVTHGLRRTRQIMAQEIERIANVSRVLDDGSKKIGTTIGEHQEVGGAIQQARHLLTNIHRQTVKSKILIGLGLLFFSSVVIYIVAKRAIYIASFFSFLLPSFSSSGSLPSNVSVPSPPAGRPAGPPPVLPIPTPSQQSGEERQNFPQSEEFVYREKEGEEPKRGIKRASSSPPSFSTPDFQKPRKQNRQTPKAPELSKYGAEGKVKNEDIKRQASKLSEKRKTESIATADSDLAFPAKRKKVDPDQEEVVVSKFGENRKPATASANPIKRSEEQKAEDKSSRNGAARSSETSAKKEEASRSGSNVEVSTEEGEDQREAAALTKNDDTDIKRRYSKDTNSNDGGRYGQEATKGELLDDREL